MLLKPSKALHTANRSPSGLYATMVNIRVYRQSFKLLRYNFSNTGKVRTIEEFTKLDQGQTTRGVGTEATVVCSSPEVLCPVKSDRRR